MDSPEPSPAAPPARSEKDLCLHLRGVMGVGSEHGRGRAGSPAFLMGLSKRKGVKDGSPLLSLLYAPRMEGRQPGALHSSQPAGKKRV